MSWSDLRVPLPLLPDVHLLENHGFTCFVQFGLFWSEWQMGPFFPTGLGADVSYVSFFLFAPIEPGALG